MNSCVYQLLYKAPTETMQKARVACVQDLVRQLQACVRIVLRDTMSATLLASSVGHSLLLRAANAIIIDI